MQLYVLSSNGIRYIMINQLRRYPYCLILLGFIRAQASLIIVIYHIHQTKFEIYIYLSHLIFLPIYYNSYGFIF